MRSEPNPQGSASSVAQEVKAGRDPRTPFAALGGTALAIIVLFVIALGVVVLAYLVAG